MKQWSSVSRKITFRDISSFFLFQLLFFSFLKTWIREQLLKTKHRRGWQRSARLLLTSPGGQWRKSDLNGSGWLHHVTNYEVMIHICINPRAVTSHRSVTSVGRTASVRGRSWPRICPGACRSVVRVSTPCWRSPIKILLQNTCCSRKDRRQWGWDPSWAWWVWPWLGTPRTWSLSRTGQSLGCSFSMAFSEVFIPECESTARLMDSCLVNISFLQSSVLVSCLVSPFYDGCWG